MDEQQAKAKKMIEDALGVVTSKIDRDGFKNIQEAVDTIEALEILTSLVRSSEIRLVENGQ
jgi:hypothetical protein